MRRIVWWLLFPLWTVFASALLFCIAEGGVGLWQSGTSFAAKFSECRKSARPTAQRYDRELGWALQPNVYEEDRFGRWRWLKTSSLGLRADSDSIAELPPGKVRVVCSGDSMTFGANVANAATWCRFLEDTNDSLTTVNFANLAWGADQSLVQYRKLGRAVPHKIHVFAVIFSDVTERVYGETYLGVPKPRFLLRDRRLSLANVPVPDPNAVIPCAVRSSDAFASLRSVALFKPAEPVVWTPPPNVRDPELLPALLRAIRDDTVADGAVPLVVLFPSFWVPVVEHEMLRNSMAAALAEDNVRFLDLSRAWGDSPEKSEAPGIFQPDGHFTTAGNRWAAEQIDRAIRELPTDDLTLHDAIAKGRPVEAPWRGRLYTSSSFSGAPIERTAHLLDLELKTPNVSMVWQSCLRLREHHHIELLLESDDGSKLFVDGKPVIDNWGMHGAVPMTAELDLPSGAHEIQVRYFNGSAGGSLRVNAKFDRNPPELLSGSRLTPPSEHDGELRCDSSPSD